MLIHGYSTSSYDFAGLAQNLSTDHYVCALDTPGYGYSDKPRNGYAYSIFDDAQLVDYYIREIAHLKEFTLVTHDKGDSVGLGLLKIYQGYPTKPYTIQQHFITNGNLYLPLAQLASGQKLLLNPLSGPILSTLMDGTQIAQGMAGTTYTPTLPASETQAMASIFDYQGGIRVEHAIIHYLDDRKINEVTRLETLGRSDIPTTLIWGEQDKIAPTAMPILSGLTISKIVPFPPPIADSCANHYIQVDQLKALAAIIRATPFSESVSIKITDANCQPFKVK